MPIVDGEFVESDDDECLPPPSSLPQGPPPPLPPPPTTTPTVVRPPSNHSSSSTTTTSTTSSVTSTTARRHNSSTSSKTKKRLTKPASSPRLESLYSSHKLQQEKIKKKRAEARDPECTFSPKLNKPRTKKDRSNPGDTTGGGSRFDRLYQSHQATQDKIARKRQEVHDEECTFKPKTNKRRPRSEKSSSSSSSSSSGTLTSGTGSRHDLLYSNAKVYQQKKEVARQSLGLEECTFSPRINDRQPKLRQPLYDYEEIGKFHFSFFSFFFYLFCFFV